MMTLSVSSLKWSNISSMCCLPNWWHNLCYLKASVPLNWDISIFNIKLKWGKTKTNKSIPLHRVCFHTWEAKGVLQTRCTNKRHTQLHHQQIWRKLYQQQLNFVVEGHQGSLFMKDKIEGKLKSLVFPIV